jgi:hypothetical protein
MMTTLFQYQKFQCGHYSSFIEEIYKEVAHATLTECAPCILAYQLFEATSFHKPADTKKKN